MSKAGTLFIICLTFGLFLSACRKEQPIVPAPVEPTPCWQKFLGEYMVYDTANNRTYAMTIEYFSGNQDDSPLNDSIRVINFDDSFIIEENFVCGINTYDLRLGIMYGISNYNNKHFNITLMDDDTVTTELRENNLQNDTIVLWFKKENTLYWNSEGVPYENAWHKHIAVKQY